MKTSNYRWSAAFTLVELLIVILIIAILSAILLPVINGARAKADSTKCLANLRQIGMAISNYANENDDVLPGPLEMNQNPTFRINSTGSLPLLLAKYLNLTPTTTSTMTDAQRASNVFVCPAFLRKRPTADAPAYAMNMRMVGGYNRPPWGLMGGAEGTEPLKRAALGQWVDSPDSDTDLPVSLSQTFAMRDTDQLASEYKVAPQATDTNLSDVPVHGNSADSYYRNALFYDMHVGRLELKDQDKNWIPPTK